MPELVNPGTGTGSEYIIGGEVGDGEGIKAPEFCYSITSVEQGDDGEYYLLTIYLHNPNTYRCTVYATDTAGNVKGSALTISGGGTNTLILCDGNGSSDFDVTKKELTLKFYAKKSELIESDPLQQTLYTTILPDLKLSSKSGLNPTLVLTNDKNETYAVCFYNTRTHTVTDSLATYEISGNTSKTIALTDDGNFPKANTTYWARTYLAEYKAYSDTKQEIDTELFTLADLSHTSTSSSITLTNDTNTVDITVYNDKAAPSGEKISVGESKTFISDKFLPGTSYTFSITGPNSNYEQKSQSVSTKKAQLNEPTITEITASSIKITNTNKVKVSAVVYQGPDIKYNGYIRADDGVSGSYTIVSGLDINTDGEVYFTVTDTTVGGWNGSSKTFTTLKNSFTNAPDIDNSTSSSFVLINKNTVWAHYRIYKYGTAEADKPALLPDSNTTNKINSAGTLTITTDSNGKSLNEGTLYTVEFYRDNYNISGSNTRLLNKLPTPEVTDVTTDSAVVKYPTELREQFKLRVYKADETTIERDNISPEPEKDYTINNLDFGSTYYVQFYGVAGYEASQKTKFITQKKTLSAPLFKDITTNSFTVENGNNVDVDVTVYGWDAGTKSYSLELERGEIYKVSEQGGVFYETFTGYSIDTTYRVVFSATKCNDSEKYLTTNKATIEENSIQIENIHARSFNIVNKNNFNVNYKIVQGSIDFKQGPIEANSTITVTAGKNNSAVLPDTTYNITISKDHYYDLSLTTTTLKEFTDSDITITNPSKTFATTSNAGLAVTNKASDTVSLNIYNEDNQLYYGQFGESLNTGETLEVITNDSKHIIYTLDSGKKYWLHCNSDGYEEKIIEFITPLVQPYNDGTNYKSATSLRVYNPNYVGNPTALVRVQRNGTDKSYALDPAGGEISPGDYCTVEGLSSEETVAVWLELHDTDGTKIAESVAVDMTTLKGFTYAPAVVSQEVKTFNDIKYLYLTIENKNSIDATCELTTNTGYTFTVNIEAGKTGTVSTSGLSVQKFTEGEEQTLMFTSKEAEDSAEITVVARDIKADIETYGQGNLSIKNSNKVKCYVTCIKKSDSSKILNRVLLDIGVSTTSENIEAGETYTITYSSKEAEDDGFEQEISTNIEILKELTVSSVTATRIDFKNETGYSLDTIYLLDNEGTIKDSWANVEAGKDNMYFQNLNGNRSYTIKTTKNDYGYSITEFTTEKYTFSYTPSFADVTSTGFRVINNNDEDVQYRYYKKDTTPPDFDASKTIPGKNSKQTGDKLSGSLSGNTTSGPAIEWDVDAANNFLDVSGLDGTTTYIVDFYLPDYNIASNSQRTYNKLKTPEVSYTDSTVTITIPDITPDDPQCGYKLENKTTGETIKGVMSTGGTTVKGLACNRDYSVKLTGVKNYEDSDEVAFKTKQGTLNAPTLASQFYDETDDTIYITFTHSNAAAVKAEAIDTDGGNVLATITSAEPNSNCVLAISDAKQCVEHDATCYVRLSHDDYGNQPESPDFELMLTLKAPEIIEIASDHFTISNTNTYSFNIYVYKYDNDEGTWKESQVIGDPGIPGGSGIAAAKIVSETLVPGETTIVDLQESSRYKVFMSRYWACTDSVGLMTRSKLEESFFYDNGTDIRQLSGVLSVNDFIFGTNYFGTKNSDRYIDTYFFKQLGESTALDPFNIYYKPIQPWQVDNQYKPKYLFQEVDIGLIKRGTAPGPLLVNGVLAKQTNSKCALYDKVTTKTTGITETYTISYREHLAAYSGSTKVDIKGLVITNSNSSICHIYTARNNITKIAIDEGEYVWNKSSSSGSDKYFSPVFYDSINPTAETIPTVLGITFCGGGGGGSYAPNNDYSGGGGGGGAVVTAFIDLTKNTTYNLQIGSGGKAGDSKDRKGKTGISSALSIIQDSKETVLIAATGGYGSYISYDSPERGLSGEGGQIKLLPASTGLDINEKIAKLRTDYGVYFTETDNIYYSGYGTTVYYATSTNGGNGGAGGSLTSSSYTPTTGEARKTLYKNLLTDDKNCEDTEIARFCLTGSIGGTIGTNLAVACGGGGGASIGKGGDGAYFSQDRNTHIAATTPGFGGGGGGSSTTASLGLPSDGGDGVAIIWY